MRHATQNNALTLQTYHNTNNHTFNRELTILHTLAQLNFLVSLCLAMYGPYKVPRDVMAGGGSGDKLPLPIKCSQWSPIASENQVQLLAFPCGLATIPSGTVSTNRRRGKKRATGASKPDASSRWGSSTLVGSSSRRRKTPISNLRCLAAIPTHEKG